MKSIDFLVMANSAGSGLAVPSMSGGDRICVELMKRWAKKVNRVQVFTGKSGLNMFKRYLNKNSIDFRITSRLIFNELNLVKELTFLFLSLIKAIFVALTLEIKPNRVIVYSLSEFWPDSVPALILKLRSKSKIRWIATFYLAAPNPFGKDNPYQGRLFIRGLLYYLQQKPILWSIKKYADLIFVTNELDRWKFIGNRFVANSVIAVRGGIDIKASARVLEPKNKKYDAVFIGRFHPQKGVLELINIWSQVCKIKKDAKLAMVGNGLLEKDVKEKIKKYGLQKNADLLGFKDGSEKIKIFKSSKIVVHPAIYDSGGMAACEAMICGLPGISFDLPALRTYYPKGMIKVPLGNLELFAKNIIRLLSDSQLFKKTQEDAVSWAKEWDWDRKANDILDWVRKELDL